MRPAGPAGRLWWYGRSPTACTSSRSMWVSIGWPSPASAWVASSSTAGRSPYPQTLAASTRWPRPSPAPRWTCTAQHRTVLTASGWPPPSAGWFADPTASSEPSPTSAGRTRSSARTSRAGWASAFPSPWATRPVSGRSRSTCAAPERAARTSCTCMATSASAAVSSPVANCCTATADTAARSGTWSSTRAMAGPAPAGRAAAWKPRRRAGPAGGRAARSVGHRPGSRARRRRSG